MALLVVTRMFFVFDSVFAVTFVSKPQSILSHKCQLLQSGQGLVKGNSISFLCDFINKALEMQRQAKINIKNRRFGVFVTPLSRRSKITEFAPRCNNKLAYSV